MPNAATVVSAILRDSGLNVSQLKLTNPIRFENDFMDSVLYKVEFSSHGSIINCVSNVDVLAYYTPAGGYIVDATIEKCFDQTRHAPFKLNNDYTDKLGTSDFRRAFVDNNTKFRLLTSDESSALAHFHNEIMSRSISDDQ